MAVSLLEDGQTVDVRDADLIEGGDKETVFTLRKITPEKQRELRKRHTRPGNYRRHESINDEALQDDLIDYIVAAWSGVVSSGQVVPCERAYKLRLDVVRKSAMLERAVIAEVVEVEEARDKSFR